MSCEKKQKYNAILNTGMGLHPKILLEIKKPQCVICFSVFLIAYEALKSKNFIFRHSKYHKMIECF